MTQIEVIPVNKFTAQWNSKSLFSHYNIRAIMKEDPSYLRRVTTISDLRQWMNSNYGPEDSHWKIIESVRGLDELYMKDAGALVLWKLQDLPILNTFDRIEQHKENDALRNSSG